MINCVILEDEKPAAAKLALMLTESKHTINLLTTLHSLEEAVIWMKNNASPDILLMDINLTDGLSFELFDQVKVPCPVVFTTAHDEYWMQAFEHNGIDYLLKPITLDKLDAALDKLEQLKLHFVNQPKMIAQLIMPKENQFKRRFLVKKGSELLSLPVEQIAYFYSSNKLVCLVNKDGHKFVMDPSLSEIEKNLDPDLFFRLNRQVLASRQAIAKVKAYAKSKLMIELNPSFQEDIVVSQENLSSFKEWMDN